MVRDWFKNYVQSILIISIFVFLIVLCDKVSAKELECHVTSSDGYDCSILTDDDVSTKDYYRTDTTITISANELIDSVYIKWDTEPGEWILSINGVDYTYGKNNYIHEYVKLPEQTNELSIVIKTDRTYISDIFAFTDGALPEWVEFWEPAYDKTDVLFISAHADDDVLFFGGLIPTYIDKGDCRLQVAYFCDFLQTEPNRRHELLDGLWTMGITHYPEFGKFVDEYSVTLEDAKSIYDLDLCQSYIVELIRKYKPQIVVSHDENGEYGHGTHMLVSELVKAAIELSKDETKYIESFSKYGPWEVKKTYLHLYPNNQIELDQRVTLKSFGGLTSYDVLRKAYLCHQSQQWMWFKVSDGYDEYGNIDEEKYRSIRCNLFGLYNSTVGNDTGNDILENIVPYDIQETVILETVGDDQHEIETDHSEEIILEETESEKQTTKLLVGIIVIIIIVVIVLIIFCTFVYKLRKRKASIRRKKSSSRSYYR